MKKQKDETKATGGSKREKSPAAKLIGSEEIKSFERKIAQRDETIAQLQAELKKQKAAALAMAADYKARFVTQQATCATLEKAKEEVFESWRKEVHDQRQQMAEINSRTGELVKDLRSRITALEDGLARESRVQELLKELEKIRAQAQSTESVLQAKVKALGEETEFLKVKLRKRGCDYPAATAD